MEYLLTIVIYSKRHTFIGSLYNNVAGFILSNKKKVLLRVIGTQTAVSGHTGGGGTKGRLLREVKHLKTISIKLYGNHVILSHSLDMLKKHSNSSLSFCFLKNLFD